MSSDSTNCNDYQEKFDSFELGLVRLSESELGSVHAHIDDCAECRAWLSDWELIQLRTRELPQLDVPSSVLQGVMSNLTPHTQLVPAISAAKKDWQISLIGMVALMVATIIFNSVDPRELGAWFVSFAVLFGLNFLMQNTNLVGEPA